MAEVIIKDGNFEEVVLKADKPVVVDFWATWYEPCAQQGPIIESFAEEFEGKYVVAKIDVDENQDIAGEYNIMSIPTIKIFKDGAAVKTAVGVQTREMLLELLEG